VERPGTLLENAKIAVHLVVEVAVVEVVVEEDVQVLIIVLNISKACFCMAMMINLPSRNLV